LPRRRLHATRGRRRHVDPRADALHAGLDVRAAAGAVDGATDGSDVGGDGGERRQAASETRPWIAPGEPIISLRGVTKSFGSHTVLEDITFDVPKGRITAILGPSGTGKSVLLKNILGLLVPERGQIWVDGDQIVGLREKRLYEVRR
jgi:ABC-type glutathione transport system ATPase component